MVKTVADFLFADLLQLVDTRECSMFVSQVSDVKAFGYVHRSNGTKMELTFDLEFAPQSGSLHMKVFDCSADPVNPVQPLKTKPALVLNVGFHELMSKKYAEFKGWLAERLTPPAEKKPQVQVPDDLLQAVMANTPTVQA